MASERLFRASQEATYAHASIRRRVEATRAALTRLQASNPRAVELDGFAVVAAAVEVVELAERIARLLLAASACIAAKPASPHDTASAAQCITGAALRCAELAAFAERLGEGIYDPPTSAPVKQGIGLLVSEREALAALTREGEASMRELAATVPAIERPCTRCGEPLERSLTEDLEMVRGAIDDVATQVERVGVVIGSRGES